MHAALRVVIHIGPQKTGTSYMQSRMHHVRHRLERHGIAYHLPPAGVAASQIVQASDVPNLLAKGGFSRFADDVAAVRARGLFTMVISNEALSKLRLDQLAPLAELFANDNVEIYAYCRRWSDRLPSQWWQQVSTGLTTPFPQWWDRILQKGANTWVVNESLLWQRFATLFGRGAIHVLSYDVLRSNGTDIADDFLHQRLGWKGVIRHAQPRREIRKMPSPIEVEVIRGINLAAQAEGRHISAGMRIALLDALRRANYQPFRDLAGDALHSMPIDDLGIPFSQSLQAMQNWQDRLVTRTMSPLVLLPRQAEFNYVPPDALDGPAAQAAFGDLLKAV